MFHAVDLLRRRRLLPGLWMMWRKIRIFLVKGNSIELTFWSNDVTSRPRVVLMVAGRRICGTCQFDSHHQEKGFGIIPEMTYFTVNHF